MIWYLWAAYGIVNAVVFLMYALDKMRSKKRRRRVQESTLLAAALAGPFGALAAMRLFRHKTRKIKFLLVPLFVVLHIVVIVLLLI